MGGLFRNSQSFTLEPRGNIDTLARHLILTDIEKPVTLASPPTTVLVGADGANALSFASNASGLYL